MNKPNKHHKSDQEILTEHQWVLKAQKNAAHFDLLYKRYFLQIYKYILQRCENEFIADDITSQTFIKALSNIKKYEYKGVPFSAWLYRIASNELNSHFRNAGKTRSIQIEESNLYSLSEELNDEDNRPQLNIIIKALNDLSSDEIELIELKYFEKRGFKEIGDILGLTTDNARVKTHRVIKKIRKNLNVK